MIKSETTVLKLPYPNSGERMVSVFVPEHEEGEALPVIYMTDGQRVFGADGTDSRYICDTAAAERQSSGRAAIIAAVHSSASSKERSAELTPENIGTLLIPEENNEPFVPQGGVFVDFLINTVMPAVESRFPVKTGRSNTAICGSGKGGMTAFYTSLSHPGAFCAAGVFSAAFHLYKPDELQRWILTKLQPQLPYLYIYSGAGDEKEMNIFEHTEQVYDFLMNCYPMHMLNEVVMFEQKHDASAWELIFKDFLHTFLTRREDF